MVLKQSAAAGEPGARNVLAPRVLETIYGDRVETLYDLLFHLTRPCNGSITTDGADSSGEMGRTKIQEPVPAPNYGRGGGNNESSSVQLEKKKAETILTRQDDPLGYTMMLNKSYVVMSETAPVLGPVSLEQRWTQQQIVERVIELQFRQELKPSHVLCSGYRKLRPSLAGSSRRRAPVGLECMSGNAAVDIVNSNSWRLLLSRVGDLVMLHILSHAAIFTPLPNDCLLQISGVPISSSVSVFRKSSMLHTGEKMLRSHAKRKLVSQSYSSVQPEGRGVKKRKKESSFRGPSTSMHGAAVVVVERSPQVFDTKCCESGADPACPNEKKTCNMLQLQESKTVNRNDEESFLAQTSCAISRIHRAKRKAQENIINGDSELLHCSDENHSSDPRKRRKLESHVQVSKASENCGGAFEADSRSHELFVNGRNDDIHHHTRNPQQAMKDSVELREKANVHSRGLGGRNIKRMTDKIIPIATPNNSLRKIDLFPSNNGEKCSILLTEATLCSENSSLRSEGASKIEETSSSLPESSRSKRVRPPSWKRRKMRRKGQEVLCQELPPQSLESKKDLIQEGSRISSVEVLNKISKEDENCHDQTGHDNFYLLQSTRCGGHQASDTEALVRSSEMMDKVHEKTTSFIEQGKVSHSTKKEKPYARICAGPSLMFINRAPIFYSSNFSRHPGLPTNHILNRMKSDDAGVDHLHASIFGSLKNMLASSSTDPNVSVDITPTRFVRRLLKQILSKAKRCAYARLLSRHCPLPEQMNSQLAESSTPFLTAATAPLPESQNGSGSCQSVSEKHEIENMEEDTEAHSPEVEEVMKLLLGPLYQPSSSGCEFNDSRSEAQATTTPWHEVNKADGNKKRFREFKQEKDIADARHTANIVSNEKALRAGLIASYTDHCSVVSFLWAACRSIIPPEMLGSKRSWRIVRSNIAHFVSLRRHEKFTVQHILVKFKVSSHSWLSVPSSASESASSDIPKLSSDKWERAQQQKKLELWLYWLFTNLLVPLIRCHFYVTEIENHRQNVFYYRKPVWAKLRNIALKDLTQRNYKKLSKKSVAEALDGKGLGFSQVRLLPKRTGVRPIANLAAPSQGTLKLRVKSERRPTLRQLFGDIEKRLVPCEAESLKDCQNESIVVGDNNHVVESSKVFLPPRIGQTSVLSRGHVSTSRTQYQNSTNASSSVVVDRPLVDSFTDFSPQKSWQSPANIQNQATSPTTWYQTSPMTKTIVTESPGSGSNRTTPSKDVIPAGSMKNYRVQRKSLKRVNYSFRSVNSVLRDVYFCLKLEKDSYPEDLGSSVFGYSDIHSKVLPFILQIKGSGAVPRLYMVVCDVTKAYDTIQQEKLLEIVSEYLRSSDYNVVKYTSVTPTLASVRISHGRSPTRACEHQNFTHLVHNLAAKHSHSIFTDQGLCCCVRREKILVLLQEHLKHNIVQIGKQFYQQTVGIPQGSTLSSILCSLFYGHFELHRLMPDLHSRLTEKFSLSLENTGKLTSACGLQLPHTANVATQTMEIDVEHMLECSFDIWSQDSAPPAGGEEEHTERCNPNHHLSCLEWKTSAHHDKEMASTVLKDSILLRLIDDSLFISTSEAAGTVFVESMHMGSDEYGCQANKRKTAASFSLQLGERVLPKKIYTTEDGACFMRWSGLLINCYTVEFQADYTRYSGEHIRSTLTVKRERNQGWHLVLKMCQYMRPKCHALFFDPRINSPATIRLNAFQAFLLCAMKFHAYVCCLPRVTGQNQPFLYEVICCTTRYMYGLLKHRMETVGAKAVEYFPFVELEWLALVAFHRILKRKQSRYRILLQVLQNQLEAPRYSRLTSCPHLSSATDEKRSSMFKYIKY